MLKKKDNINMELNAHQKQIESLIDEGFTILQIFNDNGTTFYFVVNKFEESFQSTSQSVDFCQVVGINVTDFLSVTNNMPNKNDFIARFNQFVNNSRVVRMKFSKNVKWFEWTKV